MKKEKYDSSQPILSSDLERAQATKEEAIRERQVDLLNPGVLVDSQLAGEVAPFSIALGPSNGVGNPRITINTGVGYSPIGERIIISSVSTYKNAQVTATTVTSGDPLAADPKLDNGPLTTTDNGISGYTLTPASSGSDDIPLIHDAVVVKVNRIWLGYLRTVATNEFTLRETNDERIFVNEGDGFEVRVTTTSTNPDSARFVLVGEISVPISAGTLATSNISTTNEKEAQTTISTVVPATPHQVALPAIPVDIPTVTGTSPVQTYAFVAGTPVDDQFTVDFDTGIITFNSADQGNSIDVDYNALHTRREYTYTQSRRVAAYIDVVGKTATYDIGLNVSLDDHVNTKGSGTITSTNAHGLTASDLGISSTEDVGAKLNDSGLIVPDATTTSSALYPEATISGTPADNKVNIKALLSTENVNVDGVIVGLSDISTDTSFLFVDGGGIPIANGTYTFYLDKTTKRIERSLGFVSSDDKFPIASIVWTSPSLVLPIVDLRLFGTTSSDNLRFETLGGLAFGLATGTRVQTIYQGRLVGTIAAASFTIVGKTLKIKADGGGEQPVVFTGVDPLPTEVIVSQINNGTTGVKAFKTSANKVKILGAVSIQVTNGDANPVLGFTDDSIDASALIKDIVIAGDTTTISGIDTDIILEYDGDNQVIAASAIIGNRALTQTLVWNADGTLKTITESVT